MLGTMNSYYQTLKSEVGFEDNQGMDDEDYELDDILRTLKPNTTARNFKEFLGREHNCNRTQAWRSISRKIYSQDQRRLLMLQQQDDEGKTIDPGKMKVSQLYQAFATNYRHNNQPLLEEPKQLRLLNKIIQNAPDTQPDHLLQRLPQGDTNLFQFQAKDAANVKAEMIRRNLLSRKDLMHLYRPPLKQSEIPQNNPFFSGQFVDHGRTRNTQMHTQESHRRTGSALPIIKQFNKSMYGSPHANQFQTISR